MTEPPAKAMAKPSPRLLRAACVVRTLARVAATWPTILKISIIRGSWPMSCSPSASSGAGAGPAEARSRRSSKIRSTMLRRACRSSGFTRKSSAPSRMAAAMVGRSSKAVISTTAVPGARSLIRRSSSRPSISGIRTSVRITSTGDSARADNARVPSSATRTSAAEDASACASEVRTRASSSTIRMERDMSSAPETGIPFSSFVSNPPSRNGCYDSCLALGSLEGVRRRGLIHRHVDVGSRS